jgi:hypothetical protein
MTPPRTLDINTLRAVAPPAPMRPKPTSIGVLQGRAKRWLPAWSLPRDQLGGIAVGDETAMHSACL